MKNTLRRFRTLWHLAGFLCNGGTLWISTPAKEKPPTPTPAKKTPPTQEEKQAFYDEMGWKKEPVKSLFAYTQGAISVH